MTLTSLVLAGGRSSRMGQDKAQLRWGTGTLLEHMLAVLRSAGAGRCVVSGERPGYDAIADRWPGHGPVGGLASVAAVLEPCRLLVVAVDMPLLDAAVLHPLIQGNGACVHFDTGPLPMALELDNSARTIVGFINALPDRARSLRAVQAALGSRVLTANAAQARLLVGANTPQQWSTLTR